MVKEDLGTSVRVHPRAWIMTICAIHLFGSDRRRFEPCQGTLGTRTFTICALLARGFTGRLAVGVRVNKVQQELAGQDMDLGDRGSAVEHLQEECGTRNWLTDKKMNQQFVILHRSESALDVPIMMPRRLQTHTLDSCRSQR